jgi:hypothetical protein
MNTIQALSPAFAMPAVFIFNIRVLMDNFKETIDSLELQTLLKKQSH